MTTLTRQQINTMKKSDTIVFRHESGKKGTIECIQKQTDSLFEQIVTIEVDSPSTYTKACHVHWHNRGEFATFNALGFILDRLRPNKDNISLEWDLNGLRNDCIKEAGLITETLIIRVNDIKVPVKSQVKKDNSANMIQQ